MNKIHLKNKRPVTMIFCLGLTIFTIFTPMAPDNKTTFLKTKKVFGKTSSSFARIPEIFSFTDSSVQKYDDDQIATAKNMTTSEACHIIKKNEDSYLVTSNETLVTGWFLKLNKTDYVSLGSTDEIGVSKTSEFPVIFANEKGKLITDTRRSGLAFNKKGTVSCTDGLYRICGNYYLFKKGKLQTQNSTYKKVHYYTKMNGAISCFQKESDWYFPSGKKMSTTEKRDKQVRIYADDIIRRIVKKDMSKSEKLETCFQWVVHHYSYADIPCDGEKGWTSKIGMTILQKGLGDCRGLAVGFAYLASELGYEDTYLCQDSKNIFSGSHCWASVAGKCYDPLFYNSSRPQKYLSVFHGSTPEEYFRKTHCYASQRFKPGE